MSARAPVLAWARTPPARLDRSAQNAARAHRFRLAVLLAILPMFGQFFHYIKDIPPLWALSKIWPVLVLPFALPLLTRDRAPLSRQIMLSFLWLVLVSSAIAMVRFDQNFFIGLTAQIKLLPMLSFFGLLGLLCWLRPTERELATAMMALGVITFVVLAGVWLLAPQHWYTGTYRLGDSPLLSTDNRGNRIRLPMFFGMIALFWWVRLFAADRRRLWLVLAALGLAAVIGIVRTRALVIGAAGVLAVGAFLLSGTRGRVAALIGAPLALVALFQIPYVASVFDTDATSGFSLRWITVTKAVAFLGDNPLAWGFGVGTISSINPAGLADFFNHFFFLADITWLGIVFEFGVVGAALLLFLMLRGWWFMRGLQRGRPSPFIGSLEDYIVFTMLISGLYPAITLQPGEVCSILAIGVYLHWVHREQSLRIAL